MFCGGIGNRTWPRSMCGYRAVVDDAAALGLLLTHGPERLPGAEKGPGQVDGEHLVPDLEFKGIDLDSGSSDTRVVEKEVDSAVALHCGLEEAPHTGLIGDVCGNRVQHAGQSCAAGHDRLESLFASSGQDDGPPVFGKCLRHGCSDSAATAGDDGDSLHLGWHVVSSVALLSVDKAHELCVLKLRRVGCDQVVYKQGQALRARLIQPSSISE